MIFHFLIAALATKLQFDVQRSSLPFGFEQAKLQRGKEELYIQLSYEEDLLEDGDVTTLLVKDLPENWCIALIRGDGIIFPNGLEDLMGDISLEVKLDDELRVYAQITEVSELRHLPATWTAHFTLKTPEVFEPCCRKVDIVDWGKLFCGILCSISIFITLFLLLSRFSIPSLSPPPVVTYEACKVNSDQCIRNVFPPSHTWTDLLHSFEQVFGVDQVNISTIKAIY